MPRPYVNVARNSVLIAAISRNPSSTLSVPSSTNDTAPTWMPIIARSAAAAGIHGFSAAAPAATIELSRNVRRSILVASPSCERDHFVVGNARHLESDDVAVLAEGE